INSDINKTVLYLNRVGSDSALVSAQTLSGAKRKGLFMKRTSDLWLIMARSDHSAAKCHLLFMWTLILCRIPLIATFEIKKCNLFIPCFYTYTTIFKCIFNSARCKPAS